MLLFTLSILVANIIILVGTVVTCIKTVKITNNTTRVCREINQRLDRIKSLRN